MLSDIAKQIHSGLTGTPEDILAVKKIVVPWLYDRCNGFGNGYSKSHSLAELWCACASLNPQNAPAVLEILQKMTDGLVPGLKLVWHAFGCSIILRTHADGDWDTLDLFAASFENLKVTDYNYVEVWRFLAAKITTSPESMQHYASVLGAVTKQMVLPVCLGLTGDKLQSFESAFGVSANSADVFKSLQIYTDNFRHAYRD